MAKVVMRQGENDFVGGLIFHKRVKSMMEDLPPEEDMIVDLNQLHIDSSMVGTLLALHTTCRKCERRFRIMNVSDAAIKVLKLSGLHNVLDIIDLSEQGKEQQ
jgi:anti-anti-sigma factor